MTEIPAQLKSEVKKISGGYPEIAGCGSRNYTR